MKHNEILHEAVKITEGKRDSYSSPENNFAVIAQLWDAYCKHKTKIEAHDVAVMMVLFKVGRIGTGKPKADNYVDIAGYAAWAGELITEEGVTIESKNP